MKDQNKFTYERVAIDSLKPMPKNTRKHSERNIAVIAESMRRWGQQKPIVVTEDNIVLAGNGTVAAAKKLGWDTIDIKRSDLKGNDAKAYSITDNRSAELAEYDNDNLKEELAELDAEEWDLDGLGWNDDEMKQLGISDVDFEPGTEDDQGKLDEKKKATCPECGHVFTP
jgi:ParB family chromosome partitioning protein